VPAAIGVGLLALLAAGVRPTRGRAARLVIGTLAAALVVVPVAPLVFSAPFGSQLASSWDPLVVRVAAALLIGSGAGLLLALLLPFVGGAPRSRGRRVRRPPLATRVTTARPAPPATGPASAGGLDRHAARPRDFAAVPDPAPADALDDLARRAGRGDRIALEQFVRRTQPDVWRLCRYLVDAQSADDLTGDVYEHALRALPSYEGRAPARAWLLTIARRRCADEIRRRGRARRAYGRMGAGPTAAPSRDGEVAMHDALARLDEDRRTPFVLTQLLGLSYQEAADVIGCPIGTVRSRVARARADLIDAVGPGIDDADPERGWARRRAHER